MPTESRKTVLAKFPLRLMPSVRRTAEAYSEREGVSLNQFINLAVAEKVAHLEHDAWLRSRKKPTKESLSQALKLLEQGGKNAPEPGDELPVGYRREVSASGQVPTKRKKRA